MRLRSRLNEPGGIPNVLGSFTSIQHDASYAHALVMAMEDSPAMSDKISAARFSRLANELMKQWGYTDD